MSLILFEHNKRAYEAALSLMNEEGKAAVIHPTGTGKSFIAFKLAEEHPGASVLWLSPSEYIYQTQVENLRKALGGSAESVISDIQFLTYTKLMREDLSRFKDNRGNTSPPLNAAAQQVAPAPDFIILDEFHRCGAAEWEKSVRKLLAAFPDAKVLGLSATSVRYLDGQRDMAQELFEGCITSEMSLGEAIARGILPAPNYVVSLYSYQEELKRLQKRVDSAASKVTPLDAASQENEKLLEELRRTLENAEGLSYIFYKYMKNPDGSVRRGRYIVFCSGREHMEEMMEQSKEWFSLVDPSPHMYGAYYNNPQTSSEFAAFKEDDSDHLRLLFCIDMLNEGVHVEGIDGVILLRPTVSPIVYLQQIGRALSASKATCSPSGMGTSRLEENQGKTLPSFDAARQPTSSGEGGLSWTPMIFDIVNNFESLYMIDSLRLEIEEAFAVIEQTEDEKKKFEDHFHIYDELKNCRELFSRINQNLTASWELYYQAAKSYYERHGNLHIVKSYVTETGLTVGMWLMTQRRVYSGKVAGRLTEDQIRRLNAIGMEWENGSDRKWKRGYEALKAYVAEHGDADVKADYVTEDGYLLGKWVSNLRSKWRRGEVESMQNGAVEDGASPAVMITLEQQRLLEELGMIWDKHVYQWKVNFHNAELYYREHGNLNPPRSYKAADGSVLRIWLDNQRQIYAGNKKGAAPLSQQQIRQLESIGMVWRKKCSLTET